MPPSLSLSPGRHGLETEVAHEAVRLLPERALFWPGAATLLVADPHFGKAATFRAHGIPVPAGTTAGTLARLTRAIETTGARRVVFLGDFMHHRAGRSDTTLDALATFRCRHPALALLLVRGNHDAHAGDPPAALGIETVDELREGPFAFVHEPTAVAGAYVLGGHVHPACVLGDGYGASVRLPCFHLGAEVGVLPAFGDFTGMFTVRPAPDDRLFVVVEDRVLAVPRRAK